ncbi:TLDc [Ostreococcus tauri]|uniref:TLDc n=1 Tax=Ostreococcus tauri TaxID=70448 RepID=Q00Z01_OSTTA|nr:TLDc [Ostreococcus tauri]CAL55758.1 TLDc [Ostreococcus tauri]|eukprot:XP_003081955.1 TLDc [Ostreococcus tauri]
MGASTSRDATDARRDGDEDEDEATATDAPGRADVRLIADEGDSPSAVTSSSSRPSRLTLDLARVVREALSTSSARGERAWTRLFDSDAHGMSFRGGIIERCAERGRLLIVVQPRWGEGEGGDGDEVFVAHASPGLSKMPRDDFYGDVSTRTWRYRPGGALEETSGSSERPIYCAHGFHPHANIPCGLGFFGRVGRHTVWLDERLESAHVEYGARRFAIERVEIWGVDRDEVLKKRTEMDEKSRLRVDEKRGIDEKRADARFMTQFTSAAARATDLGSR